ncbi:hypothetical protein IF1G_09164 [Cordyceps javanica]|uniref:Uncharacterized protein n=1 Tax=Cordyceps javanica TaxID=43265 RepID=A0A545URK2_9HYPO|nr:hypothetical protein IF1G_09164 [Cordyceps javanica]
MIAYAPGFTDAPDGADFESSLVTMESPSPAVTFGSSYSSCSTASTASSSCSSGTTSYVPNIGMISFDSHFTLVQSWNQYDMTDAGQSGRLRAVRERKDLAKPTRSSPGTWVCRRGCSPVGSISSHVHLSGYCAYRAWLNTRGRLLARCWRTGYWGKYHRSFDKEFWSGHATAAKYGQSGEKNIGWPYPDQRRQRQARQIYSAVVETTFSSSSSPSFSLLFSSP